MKPWEQLSAQAHEAMKALGEAGPTVHVQHREVKGYVDGGKAYFDAQDLRNLAMGMIEVANWLDERAASDKSPARDE